MSPPVETAEPPSGARPSRQQIEPAALDLIRRRGAEILGTARHYAATPEDAEDAYQRGLEILLTKAPTTEEEQLVPWLKTVVKHEAFALRRQRDRAVAVEDDALDVMAEGVPPSDQRAEQYERLRVGAEALEGLKPQERRALLLKAQGYSYNQICEITSWTYTKVNRCLTEGRRRFLERVSGIESGAECERLAPLLSRLADGEADEDDLKVLRPHLRGCLSCSAAVRDFRRVPPAVAALANGAPFIVWAAMDDGAAVTAAHGVDAATSLDLGSSLFRGADSLVGWVQERTIALSMKAQAVVEAVTAHKTAAIAASTAAIAGGGAATVQSVDDAAPKPRERPAARAESRPAPRAIERAPAPARPAAERARESTPPSVQRQAPPPAAPAPEAPQSEVTPSAPAPQPSPRARSPRPEPPPESIEGGEFGP